MRLTLKMNLDSAAFDGGDKSVRDGEEVSRIFRMLATEIGCCDISAPGGGPLHDINGNKCGVWQITKGR